MTIIEILKNAVLESLAIYGQSFTPKDFQVSETNPEFEGDYTVILFSLIKNLKKSPDVLGSELGKHIIENNGSIFYGFNVIKGFLNISVTDEYLTAFLQKNHNHKSFGKQQPNGKKIMVEYSSPNTNKPLHLGHLRNNFIGWSIAEILKANGYEVIKTCIVNDRGIHICKSMLAWQLFANGATPQSTNMKGDHFVGDYYVKFNNEYKKQVEELIQTGRTKDEAEKEAPLMKETQQMLVDWENNDAEVKQLWKKMNAWVYEGFEITYKRIGSDFDKTYYESETYLLGKDFVYEGLDKGILYKKDDESIWIDLTENGLDEKLVLRGDGTSVYITSDIGLAKQKYEQYGPDQSIYVVGDEQNYHLKVLQVICKKLGMPFADGIYHLSYGMVELPTGKMKSREGTVVDADDLIDEMILTAKRHTEELGKVKDFHEEELQKLYETLGLGAMKFYLLRVDPKKRMVFNPEESIDFHGFTGPFVQYTFARIQSVLKKVGSLQLAVASEQQTTNNYPPSTIHQLLPLEKQLILKLEQFSAAIAQARDELNPSVIANYVFHLAKIFNSFYTEHSIVNAENELKKNLRLSIADMTANVLGSGMQLLGISMPDRM
ncbi:MAG: arginine--tRNA ligase [Ginsengibacter sp.]